MARPAILGLSPSLRWSSTELSLLPEPLRRSENQVTPARHDRRGGGSTGLSENRPPSAGRVLRESPGGSTKERPIPTPPGDRPLRVPYRLSRYRPIAAGICQSLLYLLSQTRSSQMQRVGSPATGQSQAT